MRQVQRSLLAVVLVVGMVGLVVADLWAQEPRSRAVAVSAGPDGLVVKPLVAHDALHVTIAAPDGRIFERESTGGQSVVFNPLGVEGYQAPNGTYVWEARLSRLALLGPQLRALAAAARETGDPVIETAFRVAERRATLVESGAFQIREGAVVPSDRVEPRSSGGRRAQRLAAPITWDLDEAPPIYPVDQVIPDDLIVQGSECVGLDCVNNENFGFDTIRLKENNLRIHFDDTSTQAGFPANDWRIIANDSASGGQSKLSIEDSTGARTPFTIEAGATTNSVYVDSTGRVGFRTATPVLDLHVNTSNTPAHRLEQNSSGGFTAQTWDVAGNEANFFVRDVTGGSRLPFRIRPGAPTSSLDISASGDVGVGTASPAEKLHVLENVNANTLLLVQNINPGLSAAGVLRAQSDVATLNFQAHAAARTISRFGQTLGGWTEALTVNGNGLAIGTLGAAPLILGTNNANRMHFLPNGNIGLSGNTAPDSPFHQLGTNARLTAGGLWQDGSSRDIKTDIVDLAPAEAIAALQQLNPVKYASKFDPTERHVGFIAEDVPDLVASKDRKGLSPMDIVALLTRVVQERQKTIADLAAKISALEGAGPR